jgi:hypothetical protein
VRASVSLGSTGRHGCSRWWCCKRCTRSVPYR